MNKPSATKDPTRTIGRWIACQEWGTKMHCCNSILGSALKFLARAFIKHWHISHRCRAGRTRGLAGAAAVAFGLLIAGTPALAQQQFDPEYNPTVSSPRYQPNSGPVVAIDEAHGNFHTVDGRYHPFAKLLSAEGYQVRASTQLISAPTLAGIEILVIANPLHFKNKRRWRLPTPSAFTESEIAAIRDWVEGGGRLLLIADHMPFAGAAADLASVFGFGFLNGFAANVETESMQFAFAANSGLSPIPDMPEGSMRPVSSFTTFTGQAFTIPDAAIPILTLQDRHVIFLPERAWAFKDDTPMKDVTALSQGALLRFGTGKIAVFGEAGSFTAQVSRNGSKFGMNSPDAPDNADFVLNVLTWLAN